MTEGMRHGFLAGDPNRGRKTNNLIYNPMDGFIMHGLLLRHGFLRRGFFVRDPMRDPMEC